MRIDEHPKPKQKDQSEVRKNILAELEKAESGVLTLAYMYARNYALCGEDVTKEWTNAIINNQFVEQIYQKGYEDAIKDIEQGRRKDFYYKAVFDYKKRK